VWVLEQQVFFFIREVVGACHVFGVGCPAMTGMIRKADHIHGSFQGGSCRSELNVGLDVYA